MRSGGGAQKPGKPCVERTGQHADCQHQRHMHIKRQPGDGKAGNNGCEAANDDLSLGADIEKPCAKREPDPKSRQHQRNG